MKKILVLSLLFVMVSSFAYGSIFGKKKSQLIQLKGSDTILNLSQAVSEEFMKKNKDVKIAVTGGGSGTGIAALLNKTVDIALSSRDIKEAEIKKGADLGINVKEWTISFDGITVIVNKDNPMSNLTQEQIRAIFIGEIKDWKEIGGNEGTIVALSRDNSSGTHVFFKEHVLRRGNEKGPEEYKNDILYLPSNQAILNEVQTNKNAIGYIGMGYMKDTVKALDVDGVKATVENVSTKSYGIARGIYWYTDGEPKGDIKKLVDFMFSKEGQAVVAKEGFVPVK